jgi:hypothetical protein
MVNGSDLVFAAIRDQSFESMAWMITKAVVVGEVLNSLAVQIQYEESVRN